LGDFFIGASGHPAGASPLVPKSAQKNVSNISLPFFAEKSGLGSLKPEDTRKPVPFGRL
jgi:hypothetical protein